MSYQVLARKWRPRNFSTLVGQEHVVRALRHALEQKRLHHAYLFTGTRGVGKTTLARILAKCLNCETGITAEPCGRCSACEEIDGGRFVDLLEVDAATNTRVDEMRQLLDTAQYAPTRGRFKVYVIDEVHMLSNSAFNAMLKTLEEPPEHLKFVLATTDPQKIPVTVLSRCLQFNLKQMPPAAIASHIAGLLEAEGVDFEPVALQLIGRAAAGSMRDALSLLDQAIAHGGGRVATESVRDMLGTVDDTYLLRLLSAVAAGDGAQLLSIADEMQARSLSFDAALQDLAGLLLKLAVRHAAPDADDAGQPGREALAGLGRQMDAETVQLCYQIALQGRDDLALAPDEHAGFVMTLLRMLAFRPVQAVAEVGVEPKQAASPQGAESGAGAMRKSAFDGDWPALVQQLSVGGAARELARNSALVAYSERTIELAVPKAKAHLGERSYQEKLKVVLEQQFGRSLALKVVVGEANGDTVAGLEAGAREARHGEATRAVQGDRFVQDLVDIFDAKVVGSSIKANGSKN
ncbi:MAG: DNA polymerase III subunit gamma/tau [Betaproteobacteria bacterium]|nr:DNA polymerase III subunit gamma/tau [Betaproteobacteria bacterium]